MTESNSFTLKLADWFMDFFLDPAYQYEPVSTEDDIYIKLPDFTAKLKIAAAAVAGVAEDVSQSRFLNSAADRIKNVVPVFTAFIISWFTVITGKAEEKIRKAVLPAFSSVGRSAVQLKSLLMTMHERLLQQPVPLPEINYTG